MFERLVKSCKQLGPIALGSGLKYQNIVVKAAGSRRENDRIVLYVDIFPANEVIANELLDILEKEGNFTCNPMSKEIIN